MGLSTIKILPYKYLILIYMKPTFFLFFFLCSVFAFSQLTDASSFPLLKEKIKFYPEAKKLYQTYHYKIIGGSIVASIGVFTLNHSLGNISDRNPHDWRITGAGVGLIGTGLLITKGAKKKRAKAIQLVNEKKKLALVIQPNGLRLTF